MFRGCGPLSGTRRPSPRTVPKAPALTEDGVEPAANVSHQGRHPLHPRIVRQGLGSPQRMDTGILRRTRSPRRSRPFRPRKAPSNYGPVETATAFAPLHPAQRPRALQGRGGGRSPASTSTGWAPSIFHARRSSNVWKPAPWTRRLWLRTITSSTSFKPSSEWPRHAVRIRASRSRGFSCG